jgi:hypothetical protein
MPPACLLTHPPPTHTLDVVCSLCARSSSCGAFLHLSSRESQVFILLLIFLIHHHHHHLTTRTTTTTTTPSLRDQHSRFEHRVIITVTRAVPWPPQPAPPAPTSAPGASRAGRHTRTSPSLTPGSFRQHGYVCVTAQSRDCVDAQCHAVTVRVTMACTLFEH